MHERFKELRGQAAAYAFSKTGHANEYAGLPVDEVVIRKFAELIVQECVSIGNTAWLSDNSTVPVFPEQQIKQHFGIE